jgi:hypothetical protein
MPPAQRVQITQERVIVGEGAGDAAFFTHLCAVNNIQGFQCLDAGGRDKFEQYLKDLNTITGFTAKCRLLLVVGDNDDDNVADSFKRVRLAVKRAKLPVPDTAQQVMKWTTNDLKVAIAMIPFNEAGQAVRGCLETLLLPAAFERNGLIAHCIPAFGECVGANGWANGSHADKFKLRALLAAVFRADPNFGLQYALNPVHNVIPLDHQSFAGIVALLRDLPAIVPIARPTPPNSQSPKLLRFT